VGERGLTRLKVPNGIESLSDASTPSAHDLSEAIDKLRLLLDRLQP